MMDDWGVIYLHEKEDDENLLARSVESLERHHADIPYKCYKLPEGESKFQGKARVLSQSPFETTLYLGSETVILGDLTFGFNQAENFGIACCIDGCPWARRFTEITGDQIQYNTDVLFMSKKADPILQRWQALIDTMDSSFLTIKGAQKTLTSRSDQAGYSQSLVDCGVNPFVLPINWNFCPTIQKSFFGPIKIWNSPKDIPLEVRLWNEEQSKEAAILKYSGGSQI